MALDIEPIQQPTAIEPLTPQPEEVTAPAPTEAEAVDLSDELLKIPAIQALFAGSPPAVSGSIKQFEKRPEAKAILANRDPLMRAGMGFYRSLDGETAAIFNQFYISGEEIKAADQEGRLQEIAPPFDAINDKISKSGKENPIMSAKGPQGGLKTAPVPQPVQSGSGLSASAQRKLMTERLGNISPGSPTSGPAPGSGRLLNQILTPVV